MWFGIVWYGLVFITFSVIFMTITSFMTPPMSECSKS
jgi:hypothetical protein